jgi:cytochrome oxidase Cu insertion factor (SCO1/SenC/PrrC family)
MAWRIFLIILFLFLAPMILARVFYAHKTWLPRHTVNHGELLVPPQALQQLVSDPGAARRHWVLVFINTGNCDDFCWQNLHNMRQIQRALGKDMHRLQRVILTIPTVKEDEKLQQWLSANETLHWQVTQAELIRAFRHPAAWYVIDPLGNIILSYSASTNPESILDDLKYLMGVSNIG